MKRAASLAFVGALLLYGAALVAFDALLAAIFAKPRKWSRSRRAR